MHLDANFIIAVCWTSLGGVWLIGFAFTKRTLRAQPAGGRIIHLVLLVLGFAMIGSPRFSIGWLGVRFIPRMDAIEIAGLALTAAGCLFAIWARIAIGSNWGGRATVKQGHELVQNGPYAVVRHPIYTGLLASALGATVAVGEWRGLLGLALMTFAFMVKIKYEERLMLETFPAVYPSYRGRVKALIPGLW